MKLLTSAIALVAAGAGLNQWTQVQLYANGGIVSTANPLPMTGTVTSNQGGTAWLFDQSLAKGGAAVSAHVCKASAATFGGVEYDNYVNGERFLQLFSKATTPVNGDIPVVGYEFPIGIGVSNSATAWAFGASMYGPGGVTGAFPAGLSAAISTTSGVLTLATATDVTWKVMFK